jgi:alpha-L-fucosidase
MKRLSLAVLVILVMIALSMFASAAFAAEGETKEDREARLQWWNEARFGLFIHWGIYSVPAGTYKGKQIGGLGEWIMNSAKIPVAEYAKYASKFNPVKFNHFGSNSSKLCFVSYNGV